MAPQDADFSDEFCRFLQAAMPAVEAAELLLAARRDETRWWTLGELIASGIAVREEDAARYVEGLQASGLVALDAERRLQYRAAEPLAAHVATLEKVYRERPVTLIRVIYGLRDSKIRSFADAFKLRK